MSGYQRRECWGNREWLLNRYGLCYQGDKNILKLEFYYFPAPLHILDSWLPFLPRNLLSFSPRSIANNLPLWRLPPTFPEPISLALLAGLCGGYSFGILNDFWGGWGELVEGGLPCHLVVRKRAWPTLLSTVSWGLGERQGAGVALGNQLPRRSWTTISRTSGYSWREAKIQLREPLCSCLQGNPS